jgi:hypothetical protein
MSFGYEDICFVRLVLLLLWVAEFEMSLTCNKYWKKQLLASMVIQDNLETSLYMVSVLCVIQYITCNGKLCTNVCVHF